MSKPILYGTLASPPYRTVYLFLKHANALDKVELKEINLMKGEHMTPEFIEMTSGFHQVPALKDPETGLVLVESLAIIQYLAEKFKLGGDFAIPQDDLTKKHKVINMFHKTPNFTGAAMRPVWAAYYAGLFGPGFDLSAFKTALDNAKANQFKLLDEFLAKNGGYMCDFGSSAADLVVFVDIFQLTKLDFPADDLNTLHAYDFEEFPNIVAWLKKLKTVLFDEEIWTGVRQFIGMASEKLNNEFKLLDKQ